MCYIPLGADVSTIIVVRDSARCSIGLEDFGAIVFSKARHPVSFAVGVGRFHAIVIRANEARSDSGRGARARYGGCRSLSFVDQMHTVIGNPMIVVDAAVIRCHLRT